MWVLICGCSRYYYYYYCITIGKRKEKCVTIHQTSRWWKILTDLVPSMTKRCWNNILLHGQGATDNILSKYVNYDISNNTKKIIYSFIYIHFFLSDFKSRTAFFLLVVTLYNHCDFLVQHVFIVHRMSCTKLQYHQNYLSELWWAPKFWLNTVMTKYPQNWYWYLRQTLPHFVCELYAAVPELISKK